MYWQDLQLTLEPATTLVAYTDGITDTLSEDGVRFGLGRLFGALEPLGVNPAADVIAGLSSSLERFQAVAHNDDTAALVVRRLAADAGCESVIASTTVGSTAANASTARLSRTRWRAAAASRFARSNDASGPKGAPRVASPDGAVGDWRAARSVRR